MRDTTSRRRSHSSERVVHKDGSKHAQSDQPITKTTKSQKPVIDLTDETDKPKPKTKEQNQKKDTQPSENTSFDMFASIPLPSIPLPPVSNSAENAPTTPGGTPVQAPAPLPPSPVLAPGMPPSPVQAPAPLPPSPVLTPGQPPLSLQSPGLLPAPVQAPGLPPAPVQAPVEPAPQPLSAGPPKPLGKPSITQMLQSMKPPPVMTGFNLRKKPEKVQISFKSKAPGIVKDQAVLSVFEKPKLSKHNVFGDDDDSEETTSGLDKAKAELETSKAEDNAKEALNTETTKREPSVISTDTKAKGLPKMELLFPSSIPKAVDPTKQKKIQYATSTRTSRFSIKTLELSKNLDKKSDTDQKKKEGSKWDQGATVSPATSTTEETKPDERGPIVGGPSQDQAKSMEESPAVPVPAGISPLEADPLVSLQDRIGAILANSRQQQEQHTVASEDIRSPSKSPSKDQVNSYTPGRRGRTPSRRSRTRSPDRSRSRRSPERRRSRRSPSYTRSWRRRSPSPRSRRKASPRRYRRSTSRSRRRSSSRDRSHRSASKTRRDSHRDRSASPRRRRSHSPRSRRKSPSADRTHKGSLSTDLSPKQLLSPDRAQNESQSTQSSEPSQVLPSEPTDNTPRVDQPSPAASRTSLTEERLRKSVSPSRSLGRNDVRRQDSRENRQKSPSLERMRKRSTSRDRRERRRSPSPRRRSPSPGKTII